MAVIIDKIPCHLCGGLFKSVTNSHLLRKHGISTTEYREKFPEAAFESPVTKSVNDRNRKDAANTEKGALIRSKNGKRNKGRKRTQEFKSIRSERYTGEGNPFYNREHTFAVRKKLSAHNQGVPLEEWSGFSNSEYKRQWKCGKARRWSREIFERDNFTCKMCDKRGGNLEAHHIIPRRDRLDLQYDLDNGVTLCVGCHYKTFRKEHEYKDLFGNANAEKKQGKVLK